MKKKFIITLLITFVCVFSTQAQVKKPTLMVIPADNWCVKNGYMDTFNDQGTIVKVPNYKRALQNSSECYNVITKINTLMSDRSFPLKDLSAVTKSMETKDILLQLRTKAGLSQDELAERMFVTRQAVSRWERGDTIPNTETLKRLSKLFDVSINTLLGSPRELICQCCGMPLADDSISREKDGFLNEDYCKWCYADGVHLYSDMEDLIEVCVKNMPKDTYTEEEVRAYLRQLLPQLEYWKRAGEK